MQNEGFTEADWRLFRKRLPVWQERYMEKIVEEYKLILSSDTPASSKFWELDERLRKDKKDTGVMAHDVLVYNMTLKEISNYLCGEIPKYK